MTVIPLDPADLAPGRALRGEFFRFWTTAQGTAEEVYDQFTNATPVADDVTSRASGGDPGPGWWSEPASGGGDRAVLFIHGGGYGLGHAAAYVGLTSQIASRARVPVFSLEYPLSSQAPVGPATELAVTTLAKLAARFRQVAVMGDSAGGGLAFATVIEARRRGTPVTALAVFSPWTDISLSGASVAEHAIGDPLLDPAYLRVSADAYRGTVAADDPRVSPLFEPDLKLPPTLIQVGTDEVLLDDSRRIAARAAAAGTEVTLEEWQGMHHVFVLNVVQLASARRALDNAAAFLAKHWAG